MKPWAAIFLAGVVVGGAVSARAAAAGRVELADRIVAIVSDSIITTQQIENRVDPFKEAVAIRHGYGTVAYNQEAYNQELNRIGQDALNVLVSQQLILQDFKSTGFNIPETLIDEYVQDNIRAVYGQDRVRFYKELQSKGMTYEQFRKQQRDGLIINEMTHKYVPEPIISPHKVEAYYYTNRDRSYKVSDEVKTRVLILNQTAGEEPGTARKLAQEIRSQIRGGVPFEEMARIHSDGPQRAEGGANGWQELSKLNEALKGPLTQMKVGECSEVIETPTACFLILLEDRRTEHYTPLDDVREEIEKTLAVQEKSRVREQWIGRLKAKTFVRYFNVN